MNIPQDIIQSVGDVRYKDLDLLGGIFILLLLQIFNLLDDLMFIILEAFFLDNLRPRDLLVQIFILDHLKNGRHLHVELFGFEELMDDVE